MCPVSKNAHFCFILLQLWHNHHCYGLKMNPNSSSETILCHDSTFQNDLKICTNHEGQKMKTANSLAIFLLHLSHLINYCALVVRTIDQLYSGKYQFAVCCVCVCVFNYYKILIQLFFILFICTYLLCFIGYCIFTH